MGYKTYAVQPDRGMYKHFEGKVPLPEGDEVSVKMDAHTCTVTTTRPGGTLILKGQLKTVHKKNEAKSYIKAGSMNLQTQNDVFLYRDVRKIKKATDSNSNTRSSGDSSRSVGGGSF